MEDKTCVNDEVEQNWKVSEKAGPGLNEIMVTKQLITEDELKSWTGHKRRDALVNWLRNSGIPYLLGAGGRVCCTAEAINLPLLHSKRNNKENSDDIDF